MSAASANGYIDSAGKALEDYPHPSVAVDTAVLTVMTGDDHLSVLLVFRNPHDYAEDNAGGEWVLPGAILLKGDRLIDAVRRSLREKAGLDGMSPRQLHVFDDPERDRRGWVLSVAHIDVLPASRLGPLDKARAQLVPADSSGEHLPFEHGEIIDYAVAEVRARYERVPDPDGLLSEPFTILELRRVHEAVAGKPLQRDTFRRLMAAQLRPTGQWTDGTRGRPAELFGRLPHG
jgi:ADP-ribose pyrophosphatase YjhB (NUDIX family)